jgi:hypothetical protein
VELIFVFIIFKVLFIDFLKIFDIVRAFWIYTFVDDEMFSVLLPFQGMITMRALQGDGFTETIFIGGKQVLTNFTKKLAFLSVVTVEENRRSITKRTTAVFRNVRFGAIMDRLDSLMITQFIVLD